jgi:hypothetical protein
MCEWDMVVGNLIPDFEIGSLEWLRSDAYIDYFTSLDKDGGFFYERWGDAQNQFEVLTKWQLLYVSPPSLLMNSMAFPSETCSGYQWSNFEIGSLEWLRSDAYIDYFTSLDKDGGFFYGVNGTW